MFFDKFALDRIKTEIAHEKSTRWATKLELPFQASTEAVPAQSLIVSPPSSQFAATMQPLDPNVIGWGTPVTVVPGLNSSSPGRLPNYEMEHASEDQKVRRLAEFRLPTAKNTRELLNASLHSPLVPSEATTGQPQDWQQKQQQQQQQSHPQLHYNTMNPTRPHNLSFIDAAAAPFRAPDVRPQQQEPRAEHTWSPQDSDNIHLYRPWQLLDSTPVAAEEERRRRRSDTSEGPSAAGRDQSQVFDGSPLFINSQIYVNSSPGVQEQREGSLLHSKEDTAALQTLQDLTTMLRQLGIPGNTDVGQGLWARNGQGGNARSMIATTANTPYLSGVTEFERREPGDDAERFRSVLPVLPHGWTRCDACNCPINAEWISCPKCTHRNAQPRMKW